MEYFTEIEQINRLILLELFIFYGGNTYDISYQGIIRVSLRDAGYFGY